MLETVDSSRNPIVAMDANLSDKTLAAIVAHCNKHDLSSKPLASLTFAVVTNGLDW